MKHPYVAYLPAAAATVLLACGSVRAESLSVRRSV